MRKKNRWKACTQMQRSDAGIEQRRTSKIEYGASWRKLALKLSVAGHSPTQKHQSRQHQNSLRWMLSHAAAITFESANLSTLLADTHHDFQSC
jgi:hypothetical protein